MTNIDFSSFSFILFCVAGVLFAIQMAYIFGVYNRIHRKARKSLGEETAALPPLSVILVTKDSGSLIEKNLPLILEQDYPQFEVIVINDKSAGEDEDILKRLDGKYENLYHSFIPETARYVSRKKLGVAMGIRASRYDWIVVTEPYCRPESRNWLKSLAKEMRPDTEIVLGYCNYERGKGWFSRRISADLFFQSLRFLGMALAGKPYMGIGRNLAYRKELYLHHKGFSDHLPLNRGEDDLFINAVANKRNTRVAVSPESIVRMPVPPFKRIWFEDKMNALVTGHYYKGMAPYLNAFDTGTCALFHLSVPAVCIIGSMEQQWIPAAAVVLLWLIRFICGMTVWFRTSKDLGEKSCCLFPFFDLTRPLWSMTYKLRYLFRHKRDFLRR